MGIDIAKATSHIEVVTWFTLHMRTSHTFTTVQYSKLVRRETDCTKEGTKYSHQLGEYRVYIGMRIITINGEMEKFRSGEYLANYCEHLVNLLS